MLTVGADNQNGTTGADVFLSPNGGLGSGDIINGLAGTDAIVLTESGTLDASLASLTSIEELRGSSGSDTIIIAGSTVASGVVKIDGGAGDDTIKLNSWAVDLLHIAVTGVEHITGPAGRSLMVRVADYATALLLDGNGLNMTLDASNLPLTVEQRNELFSHGVDVIYQPNGYIYGADGSILRGGNVTEVNSSSGVMGKPDMAHLLSGGYVTTWDAQVGGGRGIYGQRYDATGSKVGSEFRVDSAMHAPNSYGDRYGASVTGLADGGYVIAWASLGQDGSYYGIYTQRYTNTGTAVGTETLVNTATLESQYLPQIDALANGDYVVTWRSAETYGFNSDVYFQRFSSSGVPLGAETRVNTTTAGYQEFPSISHLVNGGFVVAWMSDDGSGKGVFTQRYDALGQKAGSETRVNTTTANDQGYPAITALANGNYIVTWQSYNQDGDENGVYLQQFTADGVTVGPERLVNSRTSGSEGLPTITALSSGGFVIAWATSGLSSTGDGIYLQRYGADGAKVGVEMRVDASITNGQTPAVTALENDGFAVTWKTAFTTYQRVFSYVPSFVASGGTDLLVGTAQNDVFLALPSNLTAVDSIIGGLGDDSLQMTGAGTLDLAGLKTVSGLERIVGSSGNDTINLTGGIVAGLSSIDGGTGNNTIQLFSGGIFDFRQITLTNIATINGTNSADVIFGSAGADALDGGEGADVVRGGTGSDSLTGGSGNDLFYFSTSDLENGVIDTVTDGGASSSDLIRIDGVAYYNVSVSNVNGTARVAVNFSGGTGYIDIAGIGSSPVVIATFQSQADATALTSATRENLQITSFDWANSQGWTQYTELFSSSGQLERQFGTYDGTAGRWDFLWDPANTNATWTTRFDYFNAADQQTQQQGQYDSGGSWITTFDPGATQVYDYYITYYNSSGQATQVQSFYDSGALSGGSGITTFDATNTQAYDNYTTYYDSLGRADTINGTYDGTNGTWWVDFDQANTQGWQSLTVLYDQAGVVTQQWYTMDNGSIVNL